MAIVFAASLAGVALVLQGCGGGGTTASKTCANGAKMSVTCTANSRSASAQADVEPGKVCAKSDLSETDERGFIISLHCENGKITTTLENPTYDGECTQELMDAPAEEMCKDVTKPGNAQMSKASLGSSFVSTIDDSNMFQNMEAFHNFFGKMERAKVMANSMVALYQDQPQGLNVTEKVIYMAIGGFVVGLGVLGYYLVVVKQNKAREMIPTPVAEPTVEMASAAFDCA